jgi:type IV pilus assembly protein PilZ
MKKAYSAESEKQLTERLIKAVSMLSNERKKMLDEMIKEWERLDYREDSRIACFLAVDYSTKDRVYQDFINNLSNGGVFIETLAPFHVGQSLSMTFSVPLLSKTFKIGGTIVRTEQDGIGVQFEKKLTPYQKELIHSAINRK